MINMTTVYKIVPVLLLLLIACSGIYAQEHEISIAASYGIFKPINSETRDRFDESFTRIGLTSFDPEKPRDWRFILEAGNYNLDDGTTEIRLLPVTAGYEKGIGENPDLQPYLALRAGPYFGKADSDILDESHIGLNINATCGIVIRQRLYAEIRYDYFSEFVDTDFSGLSLSVGLKLFDIRF